MRGTLRTKPIANGEKLSLYIDYYPKVWNPVKRRYSRREFLKIHLVKIPTCEREREFNALNLEIAEKIYLGRMKSLMMDANGLFNKDLLAADFYIFAQEIIRSKKREGIDTHHHDMAIKYLSDFAGENLKFRDIDELFIKRFKDYLVTVRARNGRNRLAENTASSYFDKFLFICTEAYKHKYFLQDYTLYIDRIRKVEPQFDLLDDQELQVLLNNPCANDSVFRASIFSLLTGLRFGAIKVLKWKDIHKDKGSGAWYVRFIDPKPDRSFSHNINRQAIGILGKPPRNRESHVFENLDYSSMRYHLQKWFSTLGLLSKAKFHNWRRLYATKLLEAGEDIYTVSKMINHRDIKTTTRYVQVRLNTRFKAANKIILHSSNPLVAKMLK